MKRRQLYDWPAGLQQMSPEELRDLIRLYRRRARHYPLMKNSYEKSIRQIEQEILRRDPTAIDTP